MDVGRKITAPRRMVTTRIKEEAIEAIAAVSEAYSQPKSAVIEELACRFGPVLLDELKGKYVEHRPARPRYTQLDQQEKQRLKDMLKEKQRRDAERYKHRMESEAEEDKCQ